MRRMICISLCLLVTGLVSTGCREKGPWYRFCRQGDVTFRPNHVEYAGADDLREMLLERQIRAARARRATEDGARAKVDAARTDAALQGRTLAEWEEETRLIIEAAERAKRASERAAEEGVFLQEVKDREGDIDATGDDAAIDEDETAAMIEAAADEAQDGDEPTADDAPADATSTDTADDTVTPAEGDDTF